MIIKNVDEFHVLDVFRRVTSNIAENVRYNRQFAEEMIQWTQATVTVYGVIFERTTNG